MSDTCVWVVLADYWPYDRDISGQVNELVGTKAFSSKEAAIRFVREDFLPAWVGDHERSDESYDISDCLDGPEKCLHMEDSYGNYIMKITDLEVAI